MSTKLLYLDEFDVVLCEAKVIKVGTTEDGRTVIVLDQTCFYPRGGGQDWDKGLIKGENGSLIVEEVRLDEEGVVHHIGVGEGQLSEGDAINCQVNPDIRQLNTKLHSAGHLIDMALSELKPEWIAIRGAHYPHMSFVEYKVPEGFTLEDNFVPELQEKLNMLSNNSYDNKLLFVSKEELNKYCRHVPDNIPTNKPTRVVLYADDFGIPCGGTHIQNTQAIGKITITKAKIKKGLAKVSYAVAGIN